MAWTRLERTGGGDAGRSVLAGPRSSWRGSMRTGGLGSVVSWLGGINFVGFSRRIGPRWTSLGLAEDPELEARFASAQDLLSVAPCDVEVAQQ